jgi:hypothetical protein
MYVVILFYFQFSTNHSQRKYLFKTYPHILVYCDPVNPFWGVGLAKSEKESLDPTQWKGQNHLGKLLTKIRDEMLLDPDMQDFANKRSLENDNNNSDSEAPHENSKTRKIENPPRPPLVRQNNVMRP